MIKEVTKPETIANVSVDEQTIATLEDLLSKAKTGELKSIMFVDKYKNGECGHGWAGKPDQQMIGEVENCKFNILSQMYFPVMPE